MSVARRVAVRLLAGAAGAVVAGVVVASALGTTRSGSSLIAMSVLGIATLTAGAASALGSGAVRAAAVAVHVPVAVAVVLLGFQSFVDDGRPGVPLVAGAALLAWPTLLFRRRDEGVSLVFAALAAGTGVVAFAAPDSFASCREREDYCWSDTGYLRDIASSTVVPTLLVALALGVIGRVLWRRGLKHAGVAGGTASFVLTVAGIWGAVAA